MALSNQVILAMYNASGGAIVQGQLMRMKTSGVKQTTTAQADTLADLLGVIGPAANGTGSGGIYNVVAAGEGLVLLETGLTPTIGQKVYVSGTVAGRGTTNAPGFALPIGTIIDASTYSTNHLVMVDIQPSVELQTTPIADWSGTRYYAIDNTLGNDGNAGFSDASLTAAGAVAVKTATQLAKILPPIGRPGQKLVLAVKNTGTQYKSDGVTQDDLKLFFAGYDQVIIRSTVDFAGTATDKVVCGPATALAGPNADSTFTVAAGATTTVFTVSAGTLTAEPGLIAYRIRFITGALAGQCYPIYKNTSTQITTGVTMSGTPANGDTFLIEKAGVQYATVNVSFDSLNLRQLYNAAVIGIEAQSEFIVRGSGRAIPGVIFCEDSSTSPCQLTTTQQIDCTNSYTDEGLTARTVGCGFRKSGAGSFTLGQGGIAAQLSYSAILGTSCTINVCAMAGAIASYLKTTSSNPTFFSAIGGQSDTANASNYFGSRNTTFPTRFVGRGLTTSQSIALSGVQFESVTGTCIGINGVGCNVQMDNCLDGTGNTGIAVSFASAFDATLVYGSGNTITGGTADMRFNAVGGGTIDKAFSTLATSTWLDATFNKAIGTARAAATQI